MIFMGWLNPEKQEASGLKFTKYTQQFSHRVRLVAAETLKKLRETLFFHNILVKIDYIDHPSLVAI